MLGYMIVPLKIQGVSWNLPLLFCCKVALSLIMGTDFIINPVRVCVFVRAAFDLTSHISRCFLVPPLLRQVNVHRSVCCKVRFC